MPAPSCDASPSLPVARVGAIRPLRRALALILRYWTARWKLRQVWYATRCREADAAADGRKAKGPGPKPGADLSRHRRRSRDDPSQAGIVAGGRGLSGRTSSRQHAADTTRISNSWPTGPRAV